MEYLIYDVDEGNGKCSPKLHLGAPKTQTLGETYPNHVGRYYWILFGYKLVQAITEREI